MATRFKPFVDLAVYLVLRVLICMVQTLRIETCQVLCRWLAWAATDVLHLRGAVMNENLGHVYPEWTPRQRRRITLAMWEHLLLMTCEVAQTPRTIHRNNWRHFISVRDRRRIVQQMLDPRPKVVVSGHFGNFEVGGYVMSMLGFRTYTVARTLDNPYLDRYLNSFRAQGGQHILPKQGSSNQVQEVLDAGGVLLLLGDQYAGPKGCWVNFLGRPASCHKAIALFTLSNGAPLTVLYSKRAGRPMHFELGLLGVSDPQSGGPELSGVPALTQWYNDRMEEAIRTDPPQYWWVHRRWKGTPPARFHRSQAAQRVTARMPVTEFTDSVS